MAEYTILRRRRRNSRNVVGGCRRRRQWRQQLCNKVLFLIFAEMRCTYWHGLYIGQLAFPPTPECCKDTLQNVWKFFGALEKQGATPSIFACFVFAKEEDSPELRAPSQEKMSETGSGKDPTVWREKNLATSKSEEDPTWPWKSQRKKIIASFFSFGGGCYCQATPTWLHTIHRISHT